MLFSQLYAGIITLININSPLLPEESIVCVVINRNNVYINIASVIKPDKKHNQKHCYAKGLYMARHQEMFCLEKVHLSRIVMKDGFKQMKQMNGMPFSLRIQIIHYMLKSIKKA